MRFIKSLHIGDLTAKLPIIQGGMGVRISLSGLASAVANEGGIGVIATAGIGLLEPDFCSNFIEANIKALRKEIQKARQLTKGVLGVNIMVALSNFADLVKTAIEEKIDIIFSGAGLPLHLPSYLKEGCKTKLAPIISSARGAAIIIKKWLTQYGYIPDAIVVEGPLAGGHLGFTKEQINNPDFSLEKLVPEVIREVQPYAEKSGKPIPVIAGGGIYSGQDIRKFLKMGASGVQMATRFVTTHECDAAIEFKTAFLNARKEDMVIIDSPVGMPGRAIRNQFIDDVRGGKKKPFACPYHCIRTCEPEKSPYCIALALSNAYHGKLRSGFAFAGANAYRTKKLMSVRELIASLFREYKASANPKSQSSKNL